MYYFIFKLLFSSSLILAFNANANFISESKSKDPISTTPTTTTQPADFDLATSHFQQGNQELAFNQWMILAKKGNPDAQLNIAIMYRKGIWVQQSDWLSIRWYQKSAEAGNAMAQNNLGFMYEYGLGVSQSLKKSIFWYKKAAKQGDENAIQNLKDLKKSKINKLSKGI